MNLSQLNQIPMVDEGLIGFVQCDYKHLQLWQQMALERMADNDRVIEELRSKVADREAAFVVVSDLMHKAGLALAGQYPMHLTQEAKPKNSRKFKK